MQIFIIYTNSFITKSLKGNMNGDGRVNVSDASALTNIIEGIGQCLMRGSGDRQAFKSCKTTLY